MLKPRPNWAPRWASVLEALGATHVETDEEGWNAIYVVRDAHVHLEILCYGEDGEDVEIAIHTAGGSLYAEPTAFRIELREEVASC